MKKIAAAVLAAVMVMTIGAATSFAADSVRSGRYVDADNNGVCDYAGTECWKNEVCMEKKAGQGENFVDEDGDGACDNYVVRVRPGNCMGRGKGLRRGCNRR